MEQNSWTDYVKNEKVLPRVKKERNFIQIIKRRKADSIFLIIYELYFL